MLCGNCSATFSNSAALRKHRSRHHRDTLRVTLKSVPCKATKLWHRDISMRPNNAIRIRDKKEISDTSLSDQRSVFSTHINAHEDAAWVRTQLETALADINPMYHYLYGHLLLSLTTEILPHMKHHFTVILDDCACCCSYRGTEVPDGTSEVWHRHLLIKFSKYKTCHQRTYMMRKLFGIDCFRNHTIRNPTHLLGVVAYVNSAYSHSHIRCHVKPSNPDVGHLNIEGTRSLRRSLCEEYGVPYSDYRTRNEDGTYSEAVTRKARPVPAKRESAVNATLRRYPALYKVFATKPGTSRCDAEGEDESS